MRTFATILVSIMLALGWLHAFHDMPTAHTHPAGPVIACPSGFVCPMMQDVANSLAVSPLPAIFVFFAAIVAAFSAFAIRAVPYRPPAFVRIDTGPLALRTVCKRE